MWNTVETEGASPPSEAGFRRLDFLGGRFVRLADGRGWAFPGPSEIAAAGQAVGAEVRALLVGIAEAEDEADRLRGELALAIRLLATNYDLSPADYSRLLSSPPGSPGIAEMQMSFRDLARRHAQALKLREAPTVSQGRRFHWPTFRRHRLAPGRVGQGKRTWWERFISVTVQSPRSVSSSHQ